MPLPAAGLKLLSANHRIKVELARRLRRKQPWTANGSRRNYRSALGNTFSNLLSRSDPNDYRVMARTLTVRFLGRILWFAIVLVGVFVFLVPIPRGCRHRDRDHGKKRCYVTIMYLGSVLETQSQQSGTPPDSLAVGSPQRSTCSASGTNYILFSKWLDTNSFAFVILCPAHHSNVFLSFHSREQ